MKCPYCNNWMLSGYIPNGGQPVQWIPEGLKPSAFNFMTTERGVTLNNKFSPFKRSAYQAESYHCPHCKIVIAPTK